MDLAKCGDRVVEVMKHQRHDRPVDGLLAEPIQRKSNIVDPKIRGGAHSPPRMLDQLCAAVEADDVGPALCELRWSARSSSYVVNAPVSPASGVSVTTSRRCRRHHEMLPRTMTCRAYASGCPSRNVRQRNATWVSASWTRSSARWWSPETSTASRSSASCRCAAHRVNVSRSSSATKCPRSSPRLHPQRNTAGKGWRHSAQSVRGGLGAGCAVGAT